MAGLKVRKRVLQAPQVPTGTGYKIWYKQGYGKKSLAVASPEVYATWHNVMSVFMYLTWGCKRPVGVWYVCDVGQNPNGFSSQFRWAHFG